MSSIDEIFSHLKLLRSTDEDWYTNIPDKGLKHLIEKTIISLNDDVDNENKNININKNKKKHKKNKKKNIKK